MVKEKKEKKEKKSQIVLPFDLNTLSTKGKIVLIVFFLIVFCSCIYSLFFYLPKASQSQELSMLSVLNDKVLRNEIPLIIDRDSAMEEVEESGLKLALCDFSIKDDSAIVAKAVERTGIALRFASYRLRCNKEVVINALFVDANALQYASDSLRDDMMLVKFAMTIDPMAFQYASLRLRNDFELANIAYNLDKRTLIFATADMQNSILNNN